jgi:hypothetical protein
VHEQLDVRGGDPSRRLAQTGLADVPTERAEQVADRLARCEYLTGIQITRTGSELAFDPAVVAMTEFKSQISISASAEARLDSRRHPGPSLKRRCSTTNSMPIRSVSRQAGTRPPPWSTMHEHRLLRRLPKPTSPTDEWGIDHLTWSLMSRVFLALVVLSFGRRVAGVPGQRRWIRLTFAGWVPHDWCPSGAASV